MDCTLRAGIFKSLIDCTKELWGSANFIFDADGMRMCSMDSNHTALASLTLTQSAFISFECHEKVQIGMHLDALSMVLRSCGVDDQVTIGYTSDNDYISIVLETDRPDPAIERGEIKYVPEQM